MRYLYIFSVVALIILLTACINYTNLAAAQSAIAPGKWACAK